MHNTVRKLHRDLAKYYTETLGHQLPSQGPNLTAIAKDGKVEEAIKVGQTPTILGAVAYRVGKIACQNRRCHGSA